MFEAKSDAGIAPIVFSCLSIETFHRALPFRLKLRHLLQLPGCPKKAGFDIFGVPPGTPLRVLRRTGRQRPRARSIVPRARPCLIGRNGPPAADFQAWSRKRRGLGVRGATCQARVGEGQGGQQFAMASASSGRLERASRPAPSPSPGRPRPARPGKQAVLDRRGDVSRAGLKQPAACRGPGRRCRSPYRRRDPAGAGRRRLKASKTFCVEVAAGNNRRSCRRRSGRRSRPERRSRPARRSGVEKSLPSVSARHSTLDSGSRHPALSHAAEPCARRGCRGLRPSAGRQSEASGRGSAAAAPAGRHDGRRSGPPRRRRRRGSARAPCAREAPIGLR